MMDAEGFRRWAGVSRETLERLEAYAALLVKWQQRINLIGPGTLHDIWWRHMADSAQLAPLIANRDARIVDLGSGAGFPGLVLAILGYSGVNLVEADARKCAFLREAARVAGAGVTVHQTRAEQSADVRADFILARALAPLPRLLDLAAPFVQQETVCLFLKGRRHAEELTDSRRLWNIEADVIPSRTDSEGVILRIKAILRAR